MRISHSAHILTISTLAIAGLFLFTQPALTQPLGDSLWTFSEIRSDADGDHVLDYIGQEVTITGIANINSGLLHEHYLQGFIQNDSAGMSIFAMQIDPPIELGDSLVVRGKIKLYNGLAEVHADSYRIIKKNSTVPAPKPLKDAITTPSEYLGMLVEGEGMIIEKGTTFNGSYLMISQENIPGSIMVYVSNFHRLFEDFNFRIPRIGDKVSVTGIVTEYNPEFPDKRTYKVFLRTPDDLKYVRLPQFYQYFIFGMVVLLTLVTVIWIFVLRRQVDSKTNEIKTSLKEKDMLLREIHHRVKNSLAIVSGLIELQLDSTDSKEARDILQKSKTRIHSVGLIHEKLYQTESLSNIELDAYIKDLVEAIHGTFTEYKDDVALVFELDKVELDIKRVIPCGLLVNELVVNAFKHAFKKGIQGNLKIRIKNLTDHILLEVSDNGPGLPKDFAPIKDESLGTMLIESFSKQLDAEMEIKETKEGACFTFTIPKKE